MLILGFRGGAPSGSLLTLWPGLSFRGHTQTQFLGGAYRRGMAFPRNLFPAGLFPWCWSLNLKLRIGDRNHALKGRSYLVFPSALIAF